MTTTTRETTTRDSTAADTPARVPAAAVEELIIGRWSPRSFSSDPLGDAEIASLFEGARWAPSSFNGQPWLFLYETDGPDRPVFDSVLMPRNRAWASKAPLVGFIYANTRLPDGREPRTAEFDTGAAWMALALQARALGLYTHAMAGIDRQAAHDRLGVDAERYTVMCGFAAGRIGPRDVLPDELRQREQPSDRKPISEISHRGILGSA